MMEFDPRLEPRRETLRSLTESLASPDDIEAARQALYQEAEKLLRDPSQAKQATYAPMAMTVQQRAMDQAAANDYLQRRQRALQEELTALQAVGPAAIAQQGIVEAHLAQLAELAKAVDRLEFDARRPASGQDEDTPSATEQAALKVHVLRERDAARRDKQIRALQEALPLLQNELQRLQEWQDMGSSSSSQVLQGRLQSDIQQRQRDILDNELNQKRLVHEALQASSEREACIRRQVAAVPAPATVAVQPASLDQVQQVPPPKSRRGLLQALCGLPIRMLKRS